MSFAVDFKHPTKNRLKQNRSYISLDNKNNSVETKLYFTKQNGLLRKFDFKLNDLKQEPVYLDGFDVNNDMELFSEDNMFFSPRRLGMSCSLGNIPAFTPHIENDL